MLGYQRACEPKDDSSRLTSGKETFIMVNELNIYISIYDFVCQKVCSSY